MFDKGLRKEKGTLYMENVCNSDMHCQLKSRRLGWIAPALSSIAGKT